MSKTKVLEFGTNGRDKIRSGVNQLASAVESTLGPCGRNVLIERENQAPVITKDGVSVAKEVKIKDPVENIGAEVIKEVSMKAAKSAGDLKLLILQEMELLQLQYWLHACITKVSKQSMLE